MKKIIGLLLYAIGFIVYNLKRTSSYYMNRRITRQLGGGKRIIQYPYRIAGVNNIQSGDNINIGKDSVLMCTMSKIVLKGHFVSGPGLKIIAGDHMAVVGKFIDDVSEDIKSALDTSRECDQDVVIEEDVWAGTNVTILKGVTVGRGCIIAAGAVVTKSMPSYCIVAGIPARPIKMRWTVDQIIDHEKMLYDEKERLSRETILEIEKKNKQIK